MADCLDILQEKFRFNHRAYRDGDGIFKLDTCMLTEAFVTQIDIDPNDERIDQLCYALEKLMTMNSYKARKDQETVWVTEDEWVETLSWYVFKKPRSMAKAWAFWIASCFDVMDGDKDGFINEEEFKAFYKTTHRNGDSVFAKRAFATFDTRTTDGKVSRKQYVDAFVRYFTDPDTTYDELPLY